MPVETDAIDVRGRSRPMCHSSINPQSRRTSAPRSSWDCPSPRSRRRIPSGTGEAGAWGPCYHKKDPILRIRPEIPKKTGGVPCATTSTFVAGSTATSAARSSLLMDTRPSTGLLRDMIKSDRSGNCVHQNNRDDSRPSTGSVRVVRTSIILEDWRATNVKDP